MLSYQNQNGFDDFFDSLQAIPDCFEMNEGFGKMVYQQPSQSKYQKGFKKIHSVQNFQGLQNSDSDMKKSSSTATFDDNDHNEYQYSRHSKMRYACEDPSTKSSLSPFGSVGSLSSMVSMNGNYNQICAQKGLKVCPIKKKAVTNDVDFRVKYKTEVCKYWATHGYCSFGDNCAFAHGKGEIRQKQHISSNYKTKKCQQFHENGVCLYGIRCQFIHCAASICKPNTSSRHPNSYAKDLEDAELWLSEDPDCLCMRRKNRARLPCLVRMSSEHLVCSNH